MFNLLNLFKKDYGNSVKNAVDSIFLNEIANPSGDGKLINLENKLML